MPCAITSGGKIGSDKLSQARILFKSVTVSDYNAIPAIGFDLQPTIEFTEEIRYPDSSTCSLVLTISIKYETYEKFSKVMKEAILDCVVFAKA